MNKITCLLILVLLLISCQSNNQDSEDREDIEEIYAKRNEFMEIAKNSSGAIKAHWKRPDELVLTFNQNSLKEKVRSGIKKLDGDYIYFHEGSMIAIDQAEVGRSIMNDTVCVNVQYEDGEVIKVHCAYQEYNPNPK